MTPYAYAKWVALRDFPQPQTEIAAWGITPTAFDLVEDIRMAKCECTMTSVEFDMADVARLWEELADQGLQPQHFARVWIHTHPGDSAQPSGTDETCMREAMSDPSWATMLILAKGGQVYCRHHFNVGPCGRVEDKLVIAYHVPFPAADEAARKAWREEFDRYWSKPAPPVFSEPRFFREWGWRDKTQAPQAPAETETDERLAAWRNCLARESSADSNTSSSENDDICPMCSHDMHNGFCDRCGFDADQDCPMCGLSLDQHGECFYCNYQKAGV